MHSLGSFLLPKQTNKTKIDWNAMYLSGHKHAIPKDFYSNKNETQFDPRKSIPDMKSVLCY